MENQCRAASFVSGHPCPAPGKVRRDGRSTRPSPWPRRSVRDGRTLGTRCGRWSLPRWQAATASTTPMLCSLVGSGRCSSAAWSEGCHPPRAPSCAASGGADVTINSTGCSRELLARAWQAGARTRYDPSHPSSNHQKGRPDSTICELLRTGQGGRPLHHGSGCRAIPASDEAWLSPAAGQSEPPAPGTFRAECPGCARAASPTLAVRGAAHFLREIGAGRLRYRRPGQRTTASRYGPTPGSTLMAWYRLPQDGCPLLHRWLSLHQRGAVQPRPGPTASSFHSQPDGARPLLTRQPTRSVGLVERKLAPAQSASAWIACLNLLSPPSRSLAQPL